MPALAEEGTNVVASLLSAQGLGAEHLQPFSAAWPTGGQQEQPHILASLGAILSTKKGLTILHLLTVAAYYSQNTKDKVKRKKAGRTLK